MKDKKKKQVSGNNVSLNALSVQNQTANNKEKEKEKEDDIAKMLARLN